jgi:quercetin dioxygenase-like cupin family protein
MPVDGANLEEAMSDTTVKKVSSATSPKGEMGQIHLTSGKRVAMRLWQEEPPQADKPAAKREYETVGYVIAGRAELTLEGQTLRLEPGDAWLVPAGAEHAYRILEPFTAVEATAPPAHVHGRDEA